MIRLARIQATLAIPLLLLLVCGLPIRSLALSSLMDVSREKAQELGVTVQMQRRTDDVWVKVNFKTTGAMKGFRYADLAVNREGKRLVNAPLMPLGLNSDGSQESKQLAFYLDPSALADSTVTLFVYNTPRGGIGYRLKLSDFPITPAS